jgi:hypothetical protein
MGELIFRIFSCLLILSIYFIVHDSVFSNPIRLNGVIVDKQYEAEHNNVSTGTAVTSDGKVGVVTTHNHESEKYILIVRNQQNEIVSVDCEPKLYYSKKIGQTVIYDDYQGYFSGFSYGEEAVK